MEKVGSKSVHAYTNHAKLCSWYIFVSYISTLNAAIKPVKYYFYISYEFMKVDWKGQEQEDLESLFVLFIRDGSM